MKCEVVASVLNSTGRGIMLEGGQLTSTRGNLLAVAPFLLFLLEQSVSLYIRKWTPWGRRDSRLRRIYIILQTNCVVIDKHVFSESFYGHII